jgi:hypothetical protein
MGISLMGAHGLLECIGDPRRVLRVLDWTHALPVSSGARWAIALRLLRNRGRFLAVDAGLGMRGRPALPGRIAAEGREHLDAAVRRGPTILLTFSLGPGVATEKGLRALGYDVIVAGKAPDDSWSPSVEDDERAVLWRSHGEHVAFLYRIYRLLRAGRMVALSADGRAGCEAFDIALPGGPMTVRGGWQWLRRRTGATVLPILSRLEGTRLVVTVYPPLPPPGADAVHDLDVCRVLITGLVLDYVRRFPDHCLAAAFWGNPSDPGVLAAGETVALRQDRA